MLRFKGKLVHVNAEAVGDSGSVPLSRRRGEERGHGGKACLPGNGRNVGKDAMVRGRAIARCRSHRTFPVWQPLAPTWPLATL